MKEYLGRIRRLMLAMVAVLPDDAYGNTVVKEIKYRVGRDVNLIAVHVTQYRLEDKGFVKSKVTSNKRTRWTKKVHC